MFTGAAGEGAGAWIAWGWCAADGYFNAVRRLRASSPSGSPAGRSAMNAS
jgi:hypothetical protein